MKTFEGFPHIGERFGHRVQIVAHDDKSHCDFVANEIDALGEGDVGLLERVYHTPDANETHNPENAEHQVRGWVNFDGVMHINVAPVHNGYLCLVGKESVKDFAGLLIWVHAKCMELLEHEEKK
jgi:hypothetical protein